MLNYGRSYDKFSNVAADVHNFSPIKAHAMRLVEGFAGEAKLDTD
jgi:hypothetical protein